MRINRIHRPVVTQRAAAQLTGVVTRYRGVGPNNNNNNNNNNDHAALAERFQPGTLHKLQQLGLYANTDKSDTAHQLDAEAVAAKVTYARTNTHPSCSGGGESDRVLNTFKGAMGLPEAARWKAALDKEVMSLEKHGVFKLAPIASAATGHKVVGTRWVLRIKTKGTYKGRLVIQGFSQILCMSVTRDHGKEFIPIIQKYYTEDVVEHYGMEGCNSVYNVGPELSLNQPEERLLNEEKKRRYQGIAGVMHVFRTSHPLRHPLRGQPAGEGHVQARENSHGGGQASASLLGRVHRLLNHLRAGRLSAFCLLRCQLE